MRESILSKKHMDFLLESVPILLALIWTVGTCLNPTTPRTLTWTIATIILGISLICLLFTVVFLKRTNKSPKRLVIRDSWLFILMAASFCLHFLTIQPFLELSESYLYGLNAAWYYYISNRLLHFRATKIALILVNTGVLMGIIAVYHPFHCSDVIHAIFFVIILSALHLRRKIVQQAPTRITSTIAITDTTQFQKTKTKDNLTLTYKVLEKLPCGVIRFDENLKVIHSNLAVRKLFEFPMQQEMSNELIYEILSKINSLKIRRDREDKELLCTWLGEIANSAATPSKRQAPLTFPGNQEIVNSSHSMLNKEDTIMEKENKQRTEATDYAFISLAELFQYLTMQGGARVKELFEFDNPAMEDEVLIIDGKFKMNENYEKTIEFEIFTIIEESLACKQIIMAMKDMTVRDKVSVVENNSAFRENLFGSMSHELRTPLNSIMYSLDTSIKDAQTPAYIKDTFLVPTFRSSKYLLSIIDDLLDFSRYQLNKLEFRFETFEVAEAIEYCVEIFRSNAERKGIQLTVSIDRSIPKRIRSDKGRMSQILLNLLSNAIKFSESNGFVKLYVDSLKEEGQIGLRISVEDKGIGMTLEDQKRLIKSLEVWEMVDKTSAHSSGVGIGLFISNRLAVLLSHDDKGIKVESEEGKGSTFSFCVLDQTSKKEQSNMLGNKKESFLLSKMKNTSYSRFVEVGSKLSGLSSMNDLRVDNSMSSPCRRNSSESPRAADRSDRRKQTTLQSPKANTKKGSYIVDDILNQVNISGDSDRGTAIQQHLSQTNGLRTFPKSLVNLEFSSYSEKKEKKPCCAPILVVDDDSMNHFAMEQMLGALGLMHDTAFNGREALTKFKARVSSPCNLRCGPYRLIFMDINMPILNGIDATKQIRKYEKEKKLEKSTIIGCTAYTDQTAEYYMSIGMNDCIFKPVSFEKFSRLIGKYQTQLT